MTVDLEKIRYTPVYYGQKPNEWEMLAKGEDIARAETHDTSLPSAITIDTIALIQKSKSARMVGNHYYWNMVSEKSIKESEYMRFD